jgi:hypothetical protein
LRNHIEKLEGEFLAANPGLRRVPKQKRAELREAIRGALFAKTLPSPSTYDAVWDTRTGWVIFTSLSPKIWGLFEDHFKNTFDSLHLMMIHPFSRAQRVVSDHLRPALEKANRGATGDVLDLIQDNEWIGPLGFSDVATLSNDDRILELYGQPTRSCPGRRALCCLS